MTVKSFLVASAMLVGVTACAPTVPDSGAGVGFGDYDAYQNQLAQRDALLTTGQPILPPEPTAAAEGVQSSELAAVGIGAEPQTPADINNPAISDEQDFSAVAGRETIESDAERLAGLAAQYEVVGETALPTRNGNAGPNIVEYALSAPNVKGQEWYSRFLLFSSQSRYQRNCASYRTADDAQRDFLARGGPEKDPRGIDPDGDGFACGWDPAPFVLALQSN